MTEQQHPVKDTKIGLDHVLSNNGSTAVGTILNNDDDRLRDIGYKQVIRNCRAYVSSTNVHQEFKREFTRWSTLSYAVAVQGVLGSGSSDAHLPCDSPLKLPSFCVMVISSCSRWSCNSNLGLVLRSDLCILHWVVR